MKKYPHGISFAVGARHFEELKKRATAAGISPNQVARELVEERLDRNDQALLDALNFLAQQINELANRLEENSTEVKTLRREFGTLRTEIGEDFQGLAQVINQ